MIRSRTLPEDPTAWRDADVLEELFVERSWSIEDIVDHFEDLGSDEVSYSRVRWLLDSNNIRSGRNNRPPISGRAAMLWDADSLDDVRGGDA